MTGLQSNRALPLLPILLVVLVSGRAVADDSKMMIDPTAADFIRALTPPGSGAGAGGETVARAPVISNTRSLGRQPSVNFQIQFEFGSDRLTDEARRVLRELGAALTSQELSQFSFLIAGHTDGVGSAEYNLLLSERRARAVRDYLISTVNVSPERLRDVGWGEARPLDTGNPDGDVNRRVEITNIGGR